MCKIEHFSTEYFLELIFKGNTGLKNYYQLTNGFGSSLLFFIKSRGNSSSLVDNSYQSHGTNQNK